ncbi:MAG: preprotein translocase subunit SecD [Candidatus Berkelbacteria bacterium Licking1014_96]|uniref:Protein translocase subunit SecD n=1 Tax=Candidatus Berkelbacteria bacterium Licking1014_96 TaxID=2017149 RepID=A0A554LCX7_9BACT|nr:MAG: preprotein translocase subunit SecD [Candidatus Berkelbacteria bacterium Licking1014_96]
MRTRLWILIGIIILLVVGAAVVDWPSGPAVLGRDKLRLGLDLQGGSHLVYTADLSKIEDKNKSEAVSSVIEVIRRRIDALGVSEPIIQETKVSGENAVIVELPGVTDIEQAKSLVGKTAQLEFYEQSQEAVETAEPTADSPIPGFKPTGLNGSHLTRAEVNFGGTNNSTTTSGSPEISLNFTSDGAKLFKEITARNVGKPVAIVLDNEVISAPTVQSVIENGQAVITGKFTIEEAKDLSIQLNAGALPVPINLVEERTVGATLGNESIKKSLMAAIIGAVLVALFMIIFYRYLGLVAAIALIFYSLIALAIFKLVPVTMTLAGLAGFILSIGMAVDANILIFERTKEEERAGKDELTSIKEGFSRAWPSIRDSNVSTIITCLILFWFGTGLVRGFALTLGIGVLVSMFSAITVTRTILELLTMTKLGRKMVRI